MKSGDIPTKQELRKISKELTDLTKKAFPLLKNELGSSSKESPDAAHKINLKLKTELGKNLQKIADVTNKQGDASLKEALEKIDPELGKKPKRAKVDAFSKQTLSEGGKQVINKPPAKNEEALVQSVKQGTALINKALTKLKQELEVDIQGATELTNKALKKSKLDPSKTPKEAAELVSKIPVATTEAAKASKSGPKVKEEPGKKLKEAKVAIAKTELGKKLDVETTGKLLSKVKKEADKGLRQAAEARDKIILKARQVLHQRDVREVSSKSSQKAKHQARIGSRESAESKGKKLKARSLKAKPEPPIKENKKLVGKKVARKRSETILTQTGKLNKTVSEATEELQRRFQVVRKNVESYIQHIKEGIIRTIDAAMVLSEEICSQIKEATPENVAEAKFELQKGFAEAQTWIEESADNMLKQISDVMDEAKKCVEKSFDQVAHAKEAAGNSVKNVKLRLEKSIVDVKNKADEAVKQTKVEIGQVVDSVKELSESVLDQYEDIKDTARDTAFDIKEELKCQLRDAKHTAKESFDKAKLELTSVVDATTEKSGKALEEAKITIDFILDRIKRSED